MRTGSFGMVLRGPEVSVVEGGGKAIETEGPMGEVRLGDWRRALWAVFFRELMPHVVMAACVPVICLVAVALMGVTTFLGYHALNDAQRLNSLYGPNILTEQGVRWMTLVGCPLVGLMVGFLQARRDQAAEMWGFMTHHPVRRGVLFVGRVLAGLALYAIAAGLPLVVLMIYAATPAGGIPFHWRWELPVVADGMSGVVFYFAGWLAVQREGYLLGSRLLPVLVAAGCSEVMRLVPQFWQAATIIGLCGGVFALAAKGSAYSNGFRLKSPWVGRWATHGILFVGLWLLFLAVSASGQRGALYQADIAMRDIPSLFFNRVVKTTTTLLLRDGTLGVRTFVPPPAEVLNAAGFDSSPYMSYERVWPSKETINSEPLEHEKDTSETFSRRLPQQMPGYRDIDVFSTHVYYPSPGPGRESPGVKEDWYYVLPLGIFLGYEHVTHRLVGSIGQNGFVPPEGKAVPFESDFRDFGEEPSGWSISTSERHFLVWLKERTVTEQLRYPAGYVAEMDYYDSAPTFRLRTRAFLMHDRMEVYPPGSTKASIVVPLAFSPETHSIRVRHFPEQHRWAIWYDPKRPWYDRNDLAIEYSLAGHDDVVEFFDESGGRLGRMDVPEPYHVQWESGDRMVPSAMEEAIMRRALRRLGILQGMGGLAGNALQAFGGVLPHSNIFSDLYLPWRMPYFAESYWRAFGVSWCLPAVGMWFLARRYQVRRRWVWVVGAVVFGPMMMLLLVSIKVLPRRVRCGVCGKGTFTNRAACGSCGAAFDEPGRNGTEIFGGRQ